MTDQTTPVLNAETQAKLKALVAASGKTQTAFAAALGITQGPLNHYMHGRRRPGYRVAKELVRLAKRAKIALSLDDLLLDEST